MGGTEHAGAPSDALRETPATVPSPATESPSSPESPPAPEPPALAGSDWRRWLAGGSPREVLARIVRDDPLRMRERVAARLRAEAWLLDADRVQLRALARVARAAPAYRGRPAPDAWLDAHVARAIAELVQRDGDGGALDAGDVDHLRAFEQLARPLGLDPRALGRACAAFNRLPAPERGAFFALVLEGRELDDLAGETGAGATELARRARHALDAVLACCSTPDPSTSPAEGPR